jgi:phosphatidylinositol alpha-mannosyltransferase
VRVCLVSPYDLSHEGGVNRHALSLAAALRGLGHEVRVLGPASGAVPAGCEAVARAVPVPANGSLARIGLLAAPGPVREVLRAGAFDVVHVHEPLVPGPGRHALRHARAPRVATFHATDEGELPLQRALRAAAATGLARIDFGIAVSRSAKAFARAIYRGPTAVVPNGVDLRRFGGPARAEARGAAGPLRVLFVGRFGEPRKGFPVLLDALALLRGEGRAVEADVVGEGSWARHAERAARLGVRFHGRLGDPALADRYRAADVLCAPSLRCESFGMVLVEAMAAGCPVVASALPGYAEAARGAALLAPAGDARGLAGALRSAADDPALRARLVERGRARAAALCWSLIAHRVLHVYRRASGPWRAYTVSGAPTGPRGTAGVEGAVETLVP